MSMEVVDKSGEGLSRVYGVTISAKDLSAKLEARIAEVTPTLNIKGFRAGKVPPAHVRRLYGKALMSEVVEQALSETTQKVLTDKNLRPAGALRGLKSGQRPTEKTSRRRNLRRSPGLCRSPKLLKNASGLHRPGPCPPD